MKIVMQLFKTNDHNPGKFKLNVPWHTGANLNYNSNKRIYGRISYDYQLNKLLPGVTPHFVNFTIV